MCMLRGHLDDIFDIAWSPDSTALASGSLEHVMIVWDVQHAKAKVIIAFVHVIVAHSVAERGNSGADGVLWKAACAQAE